MLDIFDNVDKIKYVQKLLGYGITGESREQCWAIFSGEGSNGKSLLISMIEALLVNYFIVCPDLIFNKSIRRSQNTHTNHLAVLRGKRICVKDEFDNNIDLNSATLKYLTGGTSVLAREAFSKYYISFQPTFLPILLCNKKPKIDVDDNAEVRRIILIPFENMFISPDDHRMIYDENNPNHKIIDINLKDKMTNKPYLEQFLVWLVKGSIEWYRSGLGESPDCIKNAFTGYIDEKQKVCIVKFRSCLIKETKFNRSHKKNVEKRIYVQEN